MIYLDNAATTYPKPIQVIKAINLAIRRYNANPGRGGYKMSIDTSEEVFKCREKISKLFNVSNPENVVFTLNCTSALNIVLKGILNKGDHVVVSCLEHNAVMRPLQRLSQMGVDYSVAKVYPKDNDATLDSFRKSLNERTKLIVCMHVSNVWGIRLPIERISAMAKQYNIRVVVDAAQSAGIFNIDLKYSDIDYLCLAGHKGLYGPMGTGIIIIKDANDIKTIIEGGTGSNSISMEQPNMMPDKFESGTLNITGIIGLGAAIDFINSKGISNIARHEYDLVSMLYDALSSMDHIELYMPKPDLNYFAPLISFNVKSLDSENVARFLSNNGIAVRAGLHCAPSAHKFCGTLDRGAVRVCPSVFTKYSEIEFLISLLKNKRLHNL